MRICANCNLASQQDRHLSSAIIATPPPGPLLEKWFARITMHLTEKRNRHRRKTHHRRV
ncbi:MAG: hypothetical protein WAL20_12105 [Rhodomicrobium sp.]|jgi:hypothetical protein